MVPKSKARVNYERRTKTVMESFKARQVSCQECVRELDAAFERFLVPNKNELSAVRALVRRNNNAVKQEMAMRRPIHLIPKNKSQVLAAPQV